MFQMMKRLFYLYILVSLFFALGCARNIKNISADISPADSVIVGRIETVPVLWEFNLYEEKSNTEDQVSIAGKGYGLSEASKLQNQGYLFKIAGPGIYILRLQKRLKDNYEYDDILRFEVPKGNLVYFGTIRVVIDHVAAPYSREDRKSGNTSIAFKYHYERIDEDGTLKHFEALYPEIYSSYKDKIIWIPSSSRPTYVTFLMRDIHSHDTFTP
jgi:hypothetical protein